MHPFSRRACYEPFASLTLVQLAHDSQLLARAGGIAAAKSAVSFPAVTGLLPGCSRRLKPRYNDGAFKEKERATVPEANRPDIQENNGPNKTDGGTTRLQDFFRVLLGAALLVAGIGHLTWLRVEFQAQVPPWLPLDPDLVVVLSGIVEIGLGLALIFLSRYRVAIGWLTAVFFILIFPGNISQYTNRIDAFGLDTDLARAVRLLFQPLLVIWALWCTGAWHAWRNR